MVSGYSKKQIMLHWGIAVLLVVQVVLHEGMDEFRDALERGQEVVPGPLVQSHVVLGLIIFAFALYRVYVRLTRGAPNPPAQENAVLRRLAGLTHLSLYAVIILMPLSGAAVWFGGIEAAEEVHEAGMAVLLAFVALHVAGAIYQHFVLKTDVVRRMMRPE